VNVPVILIMIGVLLMGVAIEPKVWWLFLSIGFFLGWTWFIHDSALAALGSKARSGVRQVATVGSYHGVGVAKGFGIREDRDSG